MKTVSMIVLLCLSGCVGYNGAVARQLATENAVISAQVATNEVAQ